MLAVSLDILPDIWEVTGILRPRCRLTIFSKCGLGILPNAWRVLQIICASTVQLLRAATRNHLGHIYNTVTVKSSQWKNNSLTLQFSLFCNRWHSSVRISLDSGCKTERIKDFEQNCQVWGRFSWFNPGYGWVQKTAHLCKVTLRKV